MNIKTAFLKADNNKNDRCIFNNIYHFFVGDAIISTDIILVQLLRF